MTKIHSSVPHALGQEGAEKRIRTFLDQAQAKLSQGPVSAPGMPPMSGSLAQEWNGSACDFTFQAQGQSVSGTIEVSADRVDVTAKLPLAAMLFKGKIEAAVTEGIGQLLK